MRNARATVTAVGISTAVTLALLALIELALRVGGVQPREWPSIDASTEVFQGIEVDPLLGPMPRPGWKGGWFDLFDVEIDARGFRSNGLSPVTGPDATVAFLGDSCTFGWGVGTAETFVARLDARQRADGLPRIALINAAYPGQTAVVGTTVLRERVLRQHPDLVIIGFSANNAFRFSTVSDAERFRFFPLRKLVLRSRLLHVIGAWLANRNSQRRDPKERQTLMQGDAAALKRVASVSEYEAALRAMTAAARAQGSAVVFLLFPRVSLVSTMVGYEDPTLPPPLAPHVPGAGMSRREIGLLEVSCLEPARLDDPLMVLHAQRPSWRRVYPLDPAVRDLLRRGAEAWVGGDQRDAVRLFDEAVAQAPELPLALYDRGVARIVLGERDSGLRDLEQADRLACNVFLRYLVTAWRVATELHVPVVDLTLTVQARDAEELFLDAAHLTPEGHRLVADALWPVVTNHSSRPGSPAVAGDVQDAAAKSR